MKTLLLFLNPNSQTIQTKYGIIDLKNNHLTRKDKSGKTETIPIEFNRSANKITLRSGVIDPKSGKVDNNLGQVITIQKNK